MGMPLRVAIVGRPNVGKSALFNRLVQRHVAIVHDMPGVTRDRVSETVRRDERVYEFVDTGGIGLRETPETPQDIAGAVQLQAEAAIESADILLFVVDGQEGLEPLDREVASRLRKSGKPVWLGVNKLDQSRHDVRAAEFHELGFGTMFLLSAAHGRGVPGLWSALEDAAKELGKGPEAVAADRPARVAVVGRPNVGKSSLVNRLLGEDRVIVSETPGTTRDAVDLEVAVGERRFVLVDTAGVRHKRRIHTHVEMWSRHRTEKGIARAQVVLLLISAPEGPTRQDCEIASIIAEHRKPCILVVNKWDLNENLESRIPTKEGERGGRRVRRAVPQSEYEKALRARMPFLDHAPVIFVSALEGYHAPRIWRLVATVLDQTGRRFSTGVLNRLVGRAQERVQSPIRHGKRLKIYYVVQKADAPVPTFVLFVNERRFWMDSWGRYLANRIREQEPLTGCPILFELRERFSRTGPGPARGAPLDEG